MNLTITSFKLCPFAQMAIIVCNKNNIKADIKYINIMSPPDWFVKISPTGTVPLLQVDDNIIFESSVIIEFLNEISSYDMHPQDRVLKALNRSWISIGSSLFGELFSIISTNDEDTFSKAKNNINAKLAKTMAVKKDAKFFNDNNFSLVDVAFAPFFMRLKWINNWTNNVLAVPSEISKWQDNILTESFVIKSVVSGLDDIYLANIEQRDGVLVKLLV